MPSTVPPHKRAIVYVDGFNLYYGAIRGGPDKWLNLERYFSLLRPHDDIRLIRYFTALVRGSHQVNQRMYLRALESLPSVEVFLGGFKAKHIGCKVQGCNFSGPRFFVRYEEKRTDVNIGIRMLDDAYQDLCDRMILVSGDSDLVPAVNHVKKLFPSKEIIVYVPARDQVRGAAVELRSAADKDRRLPLQLLQRSQFPASFADSSGQTITKPPHW